jgi:hypothetical protein
MLQRYGKDLTFPNLIKNKKGSQKTPNLTQMVNIADKKTDIASTLNASS